MRVGLGTASLVAVVAVAVAATGRPSWWELAAVPAAFAVGMAFTLPLVRRGGVDLDEFGVRPVLSGPARRECAPWQDIVDIRAERRGSRTVPVIYLESGKVWRLRVPYDGGFLGRDPLFDQKLGTMRNMWDNYRNWRSPADERRHAD